MQENQDSKPQETTTEAQSASTTQKIERPIVKKKKFNGHLRKNNNKKERVRHHDIKDEPIDETPSIPRPIYSELFYCLRQKFFSNSNYFFEQLDTILKQIDFKEIKEGQMTLFSYAALYEKNDILNRLTEKYPQEILAEDFENNMVPFCLNKSEDTLQTVISIFDKHLSINDIFIHNLFNRMAKISYRDLNNTILLKWLEPHLTDNNCKEFWTQTLTAKNISLTNVTILNCKKLKTYLKNNYSEFETLIEEMGKTIEIKRNLQFINSNKDTVVVNSALTDTTNSPKIYLSNADEQMQNFTKEEVATKVIIKRKKAAA